jgi:hypothetical protein
MAMSGCGWLVGLALGAGPDLQIDALGEVVLDLERGVGKVKRGVVFRTGPWRGCCTEATLGWDPPRFRCEGEVRVFGPEGWTATGNAMALEGRRLSLIGAVEVWRDDVRLRSPRMEVDLDRLRVRARGPGTEVVRGLTRSPVAPCPAPAAPP